MEQDNWIAVKDRVPPQGVRVDTMISGIMGNRNEYQLRLKDDLWFFPDMSMYVYYTPSHWKFPSPSETPQL